MGFKMEGDDVTPLGPAAVALRDLAAAGAASELEIARFDGGTGVPDRWFAQAFWRGIRLAVEGYPTAAEAADALAHKILNGSRCRCGGLIHTGTLPKLESPIRWCRWTRAGSRWVSACDAPPIAIAAERAGDLKAIGDAFREAHGDPRSR